MKTLKLTRAWILICFIAVVSSAVKHPPSHHDGTSHHGDSPPGKTYQNTILSSEIQIPEQALPIQDVACISADNNIFDIMNRAKESCQGNDMKCTFYHLNNHEYEDIGIVDVNKELFNDLLTKFDDWLLTSDIENDTMNGKITRESSLDTADLNGDCLAANVSGKGGLDPSGIHIDKLDCSNNSHDDKVHVKKVHETHHSHDSHGNKLKNKNMITIDPVYNKDYNYFEVFLPKDKETGKPKTIYVKIDTDRHEFVLLDEDIDIKRIKDNAIKIDLDDLLQIADTAFSDIVKSSYHKRNNHNKLNDDTNSIVHENETNIEVKVVEATQNIINPSVINLKNSNIDANQQLIPDYITKNTEQVIDDSKNLVVLKDYINQPRYLEAPIDNLTDDILNHNLDLLYWTNNETDKQRNDVYDRPVDFETNNNKSHIGLDLEKIECFHPNTLIVSSENASGNFESSTGHENLIFDDDSFTELKDSDNFIGTNELSFSDTHPNGAVELFQDSNLESTRITSNSNNRESDSTESQLDPIPPPLQRTDLHNPSQIPNIPSAPCITAPILAETLAKVLKTDSYLPPSFPVYSLDTSQNTGSNSNLIHSSITSDDAPYDSDAEHCSIVPNVHQYTSPILPSPPIECAVWLKGSKESPFNVGFSWLPSYSRIEELRLPVKNTLSIDRLSKPQPSLPEFLDNSEPLDYIIPVVDQSIPLLYVDQEIPLSTSPCHFDADVLVAKDTIMPSLLPNSFDRIPTTSLPSSVMPCLKGEVKPPDSSPQTQLSSTYILTNDNLGFIKQPPLDFNSDKLYPILDKTEIVIPYSTYLNECPYIENPNLKPSYLEPLVPTMPLRPISKSLVQNSLPISFDYLPTKPILQTPSTPITSFSPLNPLLQVPVFIPNKPGLHLWNNIPYHTLPSSPYTGLLDQNIRIGPPPVVANQPTSNQSPGDLIENKVFRPFSTKSVPSPEIDRPCLPKNILELSPRFTHSSQVYTPPFQMALNPCSELERDLLATELHESTEYMPSNIVGSEADSSNLPPLDSTFMSSHLEMGNLPIIINTAEHEPVPVVLQNNLQNDNVQMEQSESIILHPSLLPTLLDTPVKADINFNTYTQDTNLLKTLNELPLNSNVELPLADISLINPLTSSKKANYKILEQKPNLLPIGSELVHASSKDSITSQHKIMTPEISILDSGTRLDSSLMDPSLIEKIQPDISLVVDTPSEITDFLPFDLVEGEPTLEPHIVPSIFPFGLQKLPLKFTNPLSICKSQPFEMKPCGKLVSSIPYNMYPLPFNPDLQTLSYTPLSSSQDKASASSPIIQYIQAQKLSSKIVAYEHPCNLSPKNFLESHSNTLSVPDTQVSQNSPYIQMKPLKHRNWQIPQPYNVQNILQASSELRPTSNVSPFDTNAASLTYDESRFVPETKLAFTTLPLTEMATPSNTLLLNTLKAPSDISLEKSTICHFLHKPIVLNDVMSLFDKNSLQLLKDSSFLPLRPALTSNIQAFDKDKSLDSITINTDVTKTHPISAVPSTNTMRLSSVYHPQNIPYMLQTPYTPISNSQSYSNLPLVTQFSEKIGPEPVVKLLAESIKPSEPQLFEIPISSHLIRSNTVPNEILQLLLSKEYSEPSTIPPNLTLDMKKKIGPASNAIKSILSEYTPVHFTSVSSLNTTSFSKADTSPIYPSSVSYAKPKSASVSISPPNIPFVSSLFIPSSLPIHSYTDNTLVPDINSLLQPVKSKLSNYSYRPHLALNRPMPSAVPCEPIEIYTSSYLSVPSKPLSVETAPCSSNIISELTPIKSSMYSPVYNQPISTSIYSTLPKSFTLGSERYPSPTTLASTSPIALTPTNIFSPFVSTVPLNTLTRPSNPFSPNYLNFILPESSNKIPLPSSPKCNPNLELTPQELELLRLMNTPPINPFFKSYKLQPSSKRLPIQNYSLTKQNIPCYNRIKPNLQTMPLTEELLSLDNPEDSHDSGDKKYVESNLKYPLESLSYTLAPEGIVKSLTVDLLKQNNLISSAPVNDVSAEPVTSYTPIYSKPLLRTRSGLQLLSPPLIEPIPLTTFDSTPALKDPATILPTISYSPVLKPPTPSTPAPNLPLLPSLLPNPCVDTPKDPYMRTEKLLFSPYYYAPRQDTSSPPIDPKRSDFLIPMNALWINGTPISKPKIQIPTGLNIPDNYILLSPTHIESTSQNSPSRPSITPFYGQYTTPMTSQVSSSEVAITDLCNKVNPYISYQYMSSTLPTEISLVSEAQYYDKPLYTTVSTTHTSLPKNTFKNPPVSTPYTVLPSYILESSKDLNKALWSSFPAKKPLPASVPSFTPITVPTIPLSNIVYSGSQHIASPPLTNHILPSPVFTISNPQTLNKLFVANNIPRYSLPSLALTEPLETIPVLPSEYLGKALILKSKSQSLNSHYSLPSSLPYLTQALPPTVSYLIKPVSNMAYTPQLQSKLLPLSTQYATPISASYISSPLQKLPVPASQYSLPSGSVYDTLIHPTTSAINPSITPDFNLYSEVPKTPLDSVTLSNILQPPDNSQKSLNPYSSSTVSSAPSTSNLIPFSKLLSQKPYQRQPKIKSSTNLLLESPLVEPLLTNSQYTPVSINYSNLKPAISVKHPSSAFTNDKYIGPISLVSELKTPEFEHPLSLSNLIKSHLNVVDNPLYLNYDILESSSKLPMKPIAEPIQDSATSTSNPSLLAPSYSNSKTIKETVPCEIRPDSIDQFLSLSTEYNQEIPFRLLPSYLPKPLLTTSHKISQSTQIPCKTARLLNTPTFLSLDDAKLAVNTNYVPTPPSKTSISSCSSDIFKEPLITSAKMQLLKPELIRSSPYNTLIKTDFPPLIFKGLPLTTPSIPPSQSLPVCINSQEYTGSIHGPTSSYISSSSNIMTSPPESGPQITRPIPSLPIPSVTNSSSIKPQNWFQSLYFTKPLPCPQPPIEVTPDTQILLNNLELNNYLNEPKFSTVEIPLKVNSVTQYAPVNPLFKFEPNTENLVKLIKNKANNFEATLIPKDLPEDKILGVPYKNKIIPRRQQLAKLDHFYENNHIGPRSQVFTLPTPINTDTDGTSQSTTVFSEIGKHSTNSPTKHLISGPKLDITTLSPNKYNPEIMDFLSVSPLNPVSRPQNALNSGLEINSQFKYVPNTIEFTDAPPVTSPYNNVKDLKYSGYKTYQIPSFKFSQTAINVGPPPQIYPSVVPQTAVPSSKIHQTHGYHNIENPTDILELPIPHYTPIQTIHKTKSNVNIVKENPELNEYTTIVIPKDNIEANELKTSLINYINTKKGIQDNLDTNKELTIPLGNIAIIRKEPSNPHTILTNNPSIGLKVWKSKIKLAQAELKLKFKDLSVNNFMPIVNNLNKYDVEEIRKVVKNYIDEKYGSHIEVNEPYTVDNKYSVIEDFVHSDSNNKYNLLWPTNYV